MLSLYSEGGFRKYLQFCFPEIKKTYRFRFKIEQENIKSIARELYGLESKLRCVLTKDFFVLHAAVVGDKKTLLIFMGSTHSGKSTMAASLKGRRWTVYSDETSLIGKNNLRYFSYPQFIKIRKGPKNKEQSKLLKKLRRKTELSFEDIIGLTDDEYRTYSIHLQRYYKPPPLKNGRYDFRFILLERKVVKEPAMREASKSEVIPRFLENMHRYCYAHNKRKLMKLIFRSRYYILQKGSVVKTRNLILKRLGI